MTATLDTSYFEALIEPQYGWWVVTLGIEEAPASHRDFSVFAPTRGKAIARAYERLDAEHGFRSYEFDLLWVERRESLRDAEAGR